MGPVRFVQACINGHLSDIDWNAFAHNSFNPPAHQDQLWLDEAGSGNDFDEIFVRCECGARRPLAQTKPKEKNSRVLGDCQGQMPWLKNDHESCIGRKWDEQTQQFKETGRPEPNRLLVRSASNAYFSHTMSVISIPDKTQELYDALNEFYDGDLEETEGIDSTVILKKVLEWLKEKGFSLENLDATVIIDKPKLSPHIEAIRENLSRIIGIEKENISVKAKTAEGVMFTNEACAAIVNVLVKMNT